MLNLCCPRKRSTPKLNVSSALNCAPNLRSTFGRNTHTTTPSKTWLPPSRTDAHSSVLSKPASVLNLLFPANCAIFKFSSMKLKDEIDPYPTLFYNIKICKNMQQDSEKITVQAKSFWHCNVTKCEQGALAFHLHLRFLITDKSFDFSNNKK